MAGSTSKTVSLGWFTGLAVSGGKGSGGCCMVSRSRVSRTCSSILPSKLEPRQVSVEEAW